MGDFFQGWRRKAGLVTLAIALLLTVVWMRSYLVEDYLHIRHKPSLHGVRSFDGCLAWVRVSPSQFRQRIQWRSIPISELGPGSHWGGWKFEWRWKWCGFDCGAASTATTGVRGQMWAIPYWSLVLPLTLFSAWLLLIKPRPAKSAKESSRA